MCGWCFDCHNALEHQFFAYPPPKPLPPVYVPTIPYNPWPLYPCWQVQPSITWCETTSAGNMNNIIIEGDTTDSPSWEIQMTTDQMREMRQSGLLSYTN